MAPHTYTGRHAGLHFNLVWDAWGWEADPYKSYIMRMSPLTMLPTVIPQLPPKHQQLPRGDWTSGWRMVLRIGQVLIEEKSPQRPQTLIPTLPANPEPYMLPYLEVHCTYNLLSNCSYNQILSRVTVVIGFILGL